jgi:hypothetical protein
MKEFKVKELDPGDLQDHLEKMGSEGWDYCQTLVNQRMKKNVLTNQGTIEISYLVIMKREVI